MVAKEDNWKQQGKCGEKKNIFRLGREGTSKERKGAYSKAETLWWRIIPRVTGIKQIRT